MSVKGRFQAPRSWVVNLRLTGSYAEFPCGLGSATNSIPKARNGEKPKGTRGRSSGGLHAFEFSRLDLSNRHPVPGFFAFSSFRVFVICMVSVLAHSQDLGPLDVPALQLEQGPVCLGQVVFLDLGLEGISAASRRNSRTSARVTLATLLISFSSQRCVG